MIDIWNMSILVVDDVKSMRSIIKKTLRPLGIGRRIYFSENGEYRFARTLLERLFRDCPNA